MTAPVDIERRIERILAAYAALDGCDVDDVSVDTRWVEGERWHVAICDCASGSQILPAHGAPPVQATTLDRALAELGRRVLARGREAMEALDALRAELPEAPADAEEPAS